MCARVCVCARADKIDFFSSAPHASAAAPTALALFVPNRTRVLPFPDSHVARARDAGRLNYDTHVCDKKISLAKAYMARISGINHTPATSRCSCARFLLHASTHIHTRAESAYVCAFTLLCTCGTACSPRAADPECDIHAVQKQTQHEQWNRGIESVCIHQAQQLVPHPEHECRQCHHIEGVF